MIQKQVFFTLIGVSLGLTHCGPVSPSVEKRGLYGSRERTSLAPAPGGTSSGSADEAIHGAPTFEFISEAEWISLKREIQKDVSSNQFIKALPADKFDKLKDDGSIKLDFGSTYPTKVYWVLNKDPMTCWTDSKMDQDEIPKNKLELIRESQGASVWIFGFEKDMSHSGRNAALQNHVTIEFLLTKNP